LKAGDRVRTTPLLDAEPVTLTGLDAWDAGAEIPRPRRRHRDLRLPVEDNRDVALRRRPHGEHDTAVIDGRTKRRL